LNVNNNRVNDSNDDMLIIADPNSRVRVRVKVRVKVRFRVRVRVRVYHLLHKSRALMMMMGYVGILLNMALVR
jgi:hypothetical protein